MVSGPAESLASIQYGDPIQGVAAVSVDGAKSVHTMALFSFSVLTVVALMNLWGDLLFVIIAFWQPNTILWAFQSGHLLT